MSVIIRGDLNISEMTEKERTDLVFKATAELKEAIKATTNGYMMTGALLHMIFENKLYRNHSSDVKTWQQFVADVCPFKVAMADHLRRVYCTFKDSIGDRVIPFNRLLEALPITTDDNIETVLEDAEALPRRGWEDSIRVAKGQVPSDICEHEKTITICAKCSKRLS